MGLALLSTEETQILNSKNATKKDKKWKPDILAEKGVSERKKEEKKEEKKEKKMSISTKQKKGSILFTTKALSRLSTEWETTQTEIKKAQSKLEGEVLSVVETYVAPMEDASEVLGDIHIYIRES